MNLHFLGTTGYHPNNNRQTACMMLPEIGVILDAGTGMYRVRNLIQTKTLDIFLSHVHLDHSIGLTFLYDILYGKNLDRVTVHLDGNKIDTIKNHLYDPQLFPVKPNFDLVPFPDGPIELDGMKVTTIPLEHPGGCHGFRFDWDNRSLAYITDTMASPDATYAEAISGVDTLIHECYFPDGWEERAKLTGHSCLTPVAEVAAKVGAGKTYLVHINPLEDESQPLDLKSVEHVYQNLSITKDEMVIDV